jgi:hypothetical protein
VTGIWLVLGLVLVAAAAAWLHATARKRRRRKLMQRRLSAEERECLGRRFPLFRVMPEEVRERLETLVPVFLDEKVFEPCGGLEEVTPEMRLAIAAPACLLVAYRSIDDYASLRSVLVYPDAFQVKDEWGEDDVRLGESWGSGSVVLAWQSVVDGDAHPEDGLNVVLHEFAHQLDQEDGVADGVPELDFRHDHGRWSAVFLPAYEDFKAALRSGCRSVLDDYGAESPAEFFAVATETFFERARELRKQEPELYQELSRFYGMDPAEWGGQGSPESSNLKSRF